MLMRTFAGYISDIERARMMPVSATPILGMSGLGAAPRKAGPALQRQLARIRDLGQKGATDKAAAITQRIASARAAGTPIVGRKLERLERKIEVANKRAANLAQHKAPPPPPAPVVVPDDTPDDDVPPPVTTTTPPSVTPYTGWSGGGGGGGGDGWSWGSDDQYDIFGGARGTPPSTSGAEADPKNASAPEKPAGASGMSPGAVIALVAVGAAAWYFMRKKSRAR